MAKYKEYDQNTDWQGEINNAVKNGDYSSAAVYEGYRNKKIDDMGLDYKKTNIWGSYADKGDDKEYSTMVVKPQYSSKYSGQIKSLANDILNREAFSYNPEEDETYLQYKDSYTKAGKRAMNDTIGDVAGSTGGIASSYATTAGQQTYNNYMGALADKVPELRQLAYQMYMDDYNRDLTNLGILQGLESGDYSKFRDAVGDFYTDRNYNYQVGRDKLADERYDQQWNYQLGRDKIEDERYDDQWEYSKAVDQRNFNQSEYQFDANRTDRNNQFQMNYDANNKSYNQNLAFQLWQILGVANDFIADTLGVKVGTDINAYADGRMR